MTVTAARRGFVSIRRSLWTDGVKRAGLADEIIAEDRPGHKQKVHDICRPGFNA